MARNYKDKTLRDNNRRLLNLKKTDIENVLPEYFAEDFPKLITLFEKYYDWMDSDGNPNQKIKDLYLSRDATQVPDDLLSYLEDELLLGQAYFGGFQNKREAIKFSNLLYRSKGTKYAIEQFFRGFFGVDPQVIYPKENIFKVGPEIDKELATTNDDGLQVKVEASKIGPESRKFITDDKLYQVLSLLIRVDRSITEWKDVYKLFVHPAGMYLGSELLIVSSNEVGIPYLQDEVGAPVPEFVASAAVANVGVGGYDADVTLLVPGDSGTLDRQIERSMFEHYQNLTLEELQTGYHSLGDFLNPNSKTADDSDAGGAIRDYPTMSDSDLDSAGSISDSLLKKQSFDLHKYSTDYDSDES